MTARSWRRAVEAEAVKHGASVDLTRGGHLAVRLPNGVTYYTSSTPSDSRVLRHLQADLRRMARLKRSEDARTLAKA